MSIREPVTAAQSTTDAWTRNVAGRLVEELQFKSCYVTPIEPPISLRVVFVGRSKLVFVESKVEMKLEAYVEPGASIIWLTMNGSARFEHQSSPSVQITEGSGYIWPESGMVRVTTGSQYSALAIRIEHAALEAELSRMIGRPGRAPLVFEAQMNTEATRRVLSPLLRFIYEVSAGTRSSLFDSGILSSDLEKFLIDVLLTTQPSNYSEAIRALNGTVVPRHLKSAMHAIRANPERPWKLPEIAAAGGVSIRTICVCFHRFCGCTPKQFVQTVRLARAREQILSSPRSVSVIAQECGFHHLGRFAALYRRVYGESPSETLRQANTER